MLELVEWSRISCWMLAVTCTLFMTRDTGHKCRRVGVEEGVMCVGRFFWNVVTLESAWTLSCASSV
eukprot:13801117-Ditylum_brightwellii.AAC.1